MTAGPVGKRDVLSLSRADAAYFLAGTTLYFTNKVVANNVQLAYGYPASKAPDLAAVFASDFVSYIHGSC